MKQMLITIYIYIKNIKTKDFIQLLEYNLDILFTMIFIKEKNSEKLYYSKTEDEITFMLVDKFFNYFYLEKKIISGSHLE